MQLRQLEYVAAIVRYKTMRRAAQELYISEATISQQINALENELGLLLFERTGRSLRLTKTGTQLLPDLYAILQARQKFEQSVLDFKNPVSRRIHLGLTPDIAEIFLPTIFARFRTLYSHSFLDISIGGSLELAEQLNNHALDIAVFFTSDHVAFPIQDLTLEKVYTTEMVAVAARHHHLTHKESISKAQLVNEKMIVYSRGFLAHRLLCDALETKLTEHAVCSINNFSASLSLAQSGLGIAFVPGYIMKSQQMENRVRDLRVLQLSSKLTFPLQHVIAYPYPQYQSEYLQTLIEIIKDCFHSLTYPHKHAT